MLSWLPALLELLNRVLKLFDKPVTEKIENQRAARDEMFRNIESGGRPKW